MNIANALKPALGTSDAFERRRNTWQRRLRTTFKDHPDLLEALRVLNAKIVDAKNIRDALVHGGPRLNYEKDRVECTLQAGETRYRQRSLRHHHLNIQKYGQPKNRALDKRKAAFLVKSEYWPLDVSYTLAEIEALARHMYVIYSDTMSLTSRHVFLNIPRDVSH